MDLSSDRTAARARALPVPRMGFFTLYSALMLPMFLASVDQTLLAAATPSIVGDFGGLAQSTWIALAYLVATTVTIPAYGRLGDRYGRRKLLALALGVFGFGSALGSLAPSMGWLVAARGIQGLGGGGLMVLSQALIGEIVAPRERARYQGWFAAIFMLAGLGGPVVGGLVVHYADWRWLFGGLLPLVALAIWRVLSLPQQRPAARDGLRHGEADAASSLDLGGVAGFTVATVCSLVWVTLGGHQFAWGSGQSLALAAAALVAWTLTVRHERQQAHPFLPLDLLRLKGMPVLGGTIALLAATMFALIFFLPLYLQLGHGRTPSQAGALLVPLTLGMATGSAFTGRFVSRTGRAGTLPPWGLGLAAVALLALTHAPDGAGWLSGITIVCGVGLGTVMPNAQILAQTLAGPSRLGAAAAMVSLSRAVGAALGTAVFGALVFALAMQPGAVLGSGATDAVLARSPEEAARLSQAFEWAYTCLAVVLAAGAALATRLPRLDLGRLPAGAAAAAPMTE